MSKRVTESYKGGRAVRSKLSSEEQQQAAAAADELDLLYAADEEEQQQPRALRAPAPAADELDELDLLYAAEDQPPQQQQQRQQHQKQQQQQQQRRQSPAVAVVAAVAADPPSSKEEEDAPATAALTAVAGGSDAPPAAAVPGIEEAATAAAASSPKAAQAASPAARAAPTRIQGPDLPDLQAFSNGVLLVDKPHGWTSFDVCNAIKKALRQLGVKKVGHAGTLDPAATGLLIVCTGLGTKSIDSFMAAHKEYSGTVKLGEGTPSLDAETPVEETKPWEHITDEQLQEAAVALTGDIKQVPPMFSALHHQGKRLHELARAGVTVEREARPVTITSFDLRRDESDRQLVHFTVGCTKGTYIRTLAHDLATSLGSTGHLVALRRLAIGDARVDDAWEVQQLVGKMFDAIKQQYPEGTGQPSGKRQQQKRRGKRGGGSGGGSAGSKDSGDSDAEQTTETGGTPAAAAE